MENAIVVGEAVAGRAASVRKELMYLSSGINHSSLDLAELLYEAQTNG